MVDDYPLAEASLPCFFVRDSSRKRGGGDPPPCPSLLPSKKPRVSSAQSNRDKRGKESGDGEEVHPDRKRARK